jgi:hypothetical protein
MHIPRIRQTAWVAPLIAGHETTPVSGRWRVALAASVGLWLLIGSAIGVLLAP